MFLRMVTTVPRPGWLSSVTLSTKARMTVRPRPDSGSWAIGVCGSDPGADGSGPVWAAGPRAAAGPPLPSPPAPPRPPPPPPTAHPPARTAPRRPADALVRHLDLAPDRAQAGHHLIALDLVAAMGEDVGAGFGGREQDVVHGFLVHAEAAQRVPEDPAHPRHTERLGLEDQAELHIRN